MYKKDLSTPLHFNIPHSYHLQSNMSSRNTSPVYDYNSRLQSSYTPPSCSQTPEPSPWWVHPNAEKQMTPELADTIVALPTQLGIRTTSVKESGSGVKGESITLRVESDTRYKSTNLA